MSFNNFLIEAAGPKHLGAAKFEAILINTFGLVIKPYINTKGKSGNVLIADISKFKSVVSKLTNTQFYELIVEAAAQADVELVPADETDKNGFMDAGPGGEDVIALKVKGNDYSDNKDHEETGEFNADLFIALDSLTITS